MTDKEKMDEALIAASKQMAELGYQIEKTDDLINEKSGKLKEIKFEVSNARADNRAAIAEYRKIYQQYRDETVCAWELLEPLNKCWVKMQVITQKLEKSQKELFENS